MDLNINSDKHAAEAGLIPVTDHGDEFMTRLAHAVRNPLAPIRNVLSVLRISKAEDVAVVQMYEMMERQVNRLVQLVDGLLDDARIAQGNATLRKTDVLLADILARALQSDALSSAGTGCMFDVSLPTDGVRLCADRARAVQLFTAVFEVCHQRGGPGAPLRVQAQIEGGRVAVSVNYTCANAPCARQKSVTDRPASHSLPPSGAPRSSSALRTARMLAEWHGGSLVASKEGAAKAGEIVVTLPLAGVIHSNSNHTEEPITVLPKYRVMVVDDHRDGADSLGMLLELMGVDVRIAYSGAEALGELPRFNAQVVLLDIAMPDMDGYQVAERIRDEYADRDVVLIAMTGWSEEDVVGRDGRAAFDAHLVKPVSAATLIKTLSALPNGKVDWPD